jgi:hypothetical protein
MSQDSGWHINLSVFSRRQSVAVYTAVLLNQKNVADLTPHVRQASPMPRSFIRCRYAKSRAAAAGEGATPDTNSRSSAITSAAQRKSGRLVIAETMKSQAFHI